MAGPPVTSGLILDLRADTITGLTDGAAVAAWADQSGGGHNATATGTVTYKTNRTPAGTASLLFDQQGYLTLDATSIWATATSAAEMFLVVKATVANNPGGFIEGFGFNSYYGYPTSGDIYDQCFSAGMFSVPADNIGGVAIDVTAWHVYDTRNDGTVKQFTFDGLYDALDGDTSPYRKPSGTALLGTNSTTPANEWLGELAAVVAYNRVLTDTERADVTSWLTQQYLTAPPPGPIDTYGAAIFGDDLYGGGTPASAWSWSALSVSDLPPAPPQQIIVGPWRTGPNYELMQVSNRTLTLNLVDPSTITFDVVGYPDPVTGRFDAMQLSEGVTDVLWRRDGVPLAIARLTAATDNIDANTHTISCSCVDYRALLDRRLVFQDATGPEAGSGKKTYPDNTPLADITWSLINDTQGRPGGSLGLSKGVWPTNTPIYSAGFEVADGDTVWSAIKKLAAPGPVSIVATTTTKGTDLNVVTANLPGFDIDVDPTKHVNMYYSMRGADNGVRLDFAAGFGGAITSISRSLDLVQDYANLIRQSGGDGLSENPIVFPTPGSADEAALAGRPEGRWEISVGDTNIISPDTQRAMAARNYDMYARLQPTYNLTLAPGVWNPSLIGLGDVVHVSISSGRLTVNDKLRVTSIQIELDASDRETVTLTVGRLRPDMLKFLSNTVRDLNRR